MRLNYFSAILICGLGVRQPQRVLKLIVILCIYSKYFNVLDAVRKEPYMQAHAMRAYANNLQPKHLMHCGSELARGGDQTLGSGRTRPAAPPLRD
eukprot:2194556-Pleurochrysis_carterae.AAC.1